MKRNFILVAIFLLVIIGITTIQTSHSISEEQSLTVEENGIVYIDKLTDVLEVEGATELSKPQIKELEINNISAKVSNPGDFISYEFSFINDTNNNITIKDIEKNIECSSSSLEEEVVKEICSNISLDLIYSNDSLKEVEAKDLIFANSENQITMNLIYNNSPSSPEDIDLEVKNASIKIVY